MKEKTIDHIDWVEPEIIEWDHQEGLTRFLVDRETKIGTIKIFAPPLTNAHSRMVRAHELLHAAHDRPTVADINNGDSGLNQHVMDREEYIANQAIDDVAVHLVYWPKGQDLEADRECAEVGLSDLKRLTIEVSKDFSDDDIGAVLTITVRSMAILKLLGTTAQQLQGSVYALQLFDSDIIDSLKTVMQLVVNGEKPKALKAFMGVDKQLSDKYNTVPKKLREVLGTLGLLGANLSGLGENGKLKLLH